MIPFKKYYILKEAKADPTGKKIILHLSHLEDLIIEKGLPGIEKFIKAVEEVLDIELLKKGEVKLSLKYDGSPGIFAGIDPSDNKFFVSTKSINNIEPKLVKSKEDIKLFESPGLQEKLLAAFEQLSKLKLEKNVVYQGDILFTQDDKKVETIKGDKLLTFTPNTITYSVPIDPKSEFYNRINKAKFGVIIHTKYSTEKDGNRFILSQISPEFGKLISQADKIKDLYLDDPILKGTDIENLNFENKSNVEANLILIKDLSSKLNKNIIPKMEEIKGFIPRLQVFINSELDQPNLGIFGEAGKGKKFDVNAFFKRMKKSFSSWWDKEIGKAKSLKGEISKLQTKKSWLKFIDDNESDLSQIFRVYYIMILTKNLLLDDLNKIEGNLIKTFVKEGDVYRPTTGEGIVIIGTKYGSNVTLKIVDRIEFSLLNRMLSQMRK